LRRRHHGDLCDDHYHDDSGAEDPARALAELGMVEERSASPLLRAAEDFRRQPDHPAHDSESTHRKLDAGLEHRSVRRNCARSRFMALPAEEFLMKPAVALLAFTAALSAQPRVDNVLEKMVPPGATSLVGARMDQIKLTAIYRKLLATQNLQQLDQFATETGF